MIAGCIDCFATSLPALRPFEAWFVLGLCCVVVAGTFWQHMADRRSLQQAGKAAELTTTEHNALS